jgi:hypothetical protein
MVIDMAETSPKDPNQLSEIYATKNNLTGNNIPVITENTIKPSRKFFLFKILRSQSNKHGFER